jgi:argininosuccinate synthase
MAKSPTSKKSTAKPAAKSVKPAAAKKAAKAVAAPEGGFKLFNGKRLKKVCLAYSGGLDTSIMITWLKETYGCEVVAFAADVGQGKIETAPLMRKAKATGAVKCIVADLRKEFLEEYVWPTLRAGAKYESVYLLGTSFARPVIAKHQVLTALAEGCDAVAHGATGKGNDQVRFELTFQAMAPQLAIVAPWKDPNWKITSREEAIDYAEARGIELTVTKKKIYSEDANLWHVSHEGGKLEYPEQEHGFEMLRWTTPPQQAPDKAEYVTVDFEKGTPVGVNGKRLDAVALLEALNKVGAKHGVGLVDMVENRLVGMKSRGVYETPGGAILYAAHEWLEQLVSSTATPCARSAAWPTSTPTSSTTDAGSPRCARRWTRSSTRPRRSCRDPSRSSSTRATSCWPAWIRPGASTTPHLGGFSDVPTYDQKDAMGFIRCYGLPMKVRHMLLGKKTPGQASDHLGGCGSGFSLPRGPIQPVAVPCTRTAPALDPPRRCACISLARPGRRLPPRILPSSVARSGSVTVPHADASRIRTRCGVVCHPRISPQDGAIPERSLVAHRLIAERLLGEPAVLERAKARLERWTREGRIHPEWSSRWSALLERPPQDIADFLVDPAQSDLRQTSPFAGEIDPRERWKVWRSVA